MSLIRRDGLQPVAPAAASAHFPPHLVWGVATSAFPIDGATIDDGKGESIRDRLCRVPGAIADHGGGHIAGDHRHRLGEDLDLIAANDAIDAAGRSAA
ncbi:MAG: family 1 glycosylhydrolase [Aquabacterium sp.]|nr:family 1 glycosylhydrolase [Aquabacterium sp.]